MNHRVSSGLVLARRWRRTLAGLLFAALAGIAATAAPRAAPTGALAGAPQTAAAGDEIVIRATRLDPPVFATTTERRITFVNQSGRPAHVEFVGRAGEHRVFQIPGRIWAVLHQPGRHPYVVHIEVGPRSTLAGAIEVAPEHVSARPLTCATVTVMEVCLEP